MADELGKCKVCNVPLQGQGIWCIPCFEKYVVRCLYCGKISRGGKYVVDRNDKGKEVDCSRCNNTRWIEALPEPKRARQEK